MFTPPKNISLYPPNFKFLEITLEGESLCLSLIYIDIYIVFDASNKSIGPRDQILTSERRKVEPTESKGKNNQSATFQQTLVSE